MINSFAKLLPVFANPCTAVARKQLNLALNDVKDFGRPTVETKYPRAQKCCPMKPRLRSP